MSAFELFKKKHGEPQKCEKVSEKLIKTFTGKLPDILLEEWKETGLCSYGGGLLWTVNPEDYDDILDDWLDKPTGCYAFLRTAFGSVFFWNGSDNYFLDVVEKDISRVFDRVDSVFNGTLCDDNYLKSVILRPFFKKALAKFGALEKNECYGILPPLDMGGELALDNVKKVKIREYLAVLTEL